MKKYKWYCKNCDFTSNKSRNIDEHKLHCNNINFKKKNILLLGTCRIRNIFDNIKSEKYNFFNHEIDYIGRTYSLKDTFELLNLIVKKKYNFKSYEFRFDTKKLKRNINFISNNFNKFDYILIEISSIKYFEINNSYYDSNVLLSPNYNKVNNNIFKLKKLDDISMENYFDKIINILKDKKIIFVTHLKSDLIKNRKEIKLLLQKKVKSLNNKNIFLIIPENTFKINNINEYLLDDNHYNEKCKSIIANNFLNFIDNIN
jgi:hypothetical protein